jgi:hypothetical protein
MNCIGCGEEVLSTDGDGFCFRCSVCEISGVAPNTAGGTKHDNGKPPMELLARGWLEGVADVLAFGANKYGRWNWAKGLAQSRLIGAALRHIHAFNSGEDLDKESGLSHLYHASCCLMMASEMMRTRPDLDDRFKGEEE